MSTSLYNPRGRLITVEDKEVPKLLKIGFTYPPIDHTSGTYNQIYDKGEDIVRNNPLTNKLEHKNQPVKSQGDILGVEWV